MRANTLRKLFSVTLALAVGGFALASIAFAEDTPSVEVQPAQGETAPPAQLPVETPAAGSVTSTDSSGATTNQKDLVSNCKTRPAAAKANAKSAAGPNASSNSYANSFMNGFSGGTTSGSTVSSATKKAQPARAASPTYNSYAYRAVQNNSRVSSGGVTGGVIQGRGIRPDPRLGTPNLFGDPAKVKSLQDALRKYHSF